jgi:hypothetical protein
MGYAFFAIHHGAVPELPLEVAHRWPFLTLVAACGGRIVSHVGAARLRIDVVTMVLVPWRRYLHLFLPPLMPSLVPWVATLDGSSLSLLGVTSLLP